ncbi:MAG: hypothetical protein HOL41_17455 [Rhodospirillaceae bacterium]|nr:hypothetical protein [Rhodospirillaceae bacterium]
MKLYYSGNSPYARRARIAIIEVGLPDRVEQIDLTPRDENDAVLFANGPGGKVPALETDSGAFLVETLIITRYLDEMSGGKLYPSDPAARDLALQIEGVSTLLMDSLFLRSHETRRDPSEQSPALIEKESGRAGRSYNALEAFAADFGDAVHMGTISAVSALGYADWRHAGDHWRAGRPALSAWFERIMQRPAMAETKPIF